MFRQFYFPVNALSDWLNEHSRMWEFVCIVKIVNPESASEGVALVLMKRRPMV